MPHIEDALPWNLGLHGDGGRIGVELEVAWRVGVRSEEKLATGVDGEPREVPIEILAAGKAVDLHCDAEFGAGGENDLSPGAKARTIVEVTGPRVGEDVNAGGRNGPE